MRLSKAGVAIQEVNSAGFDMTGTDYNSTIQDFTSSEAALRKGDVGTAGWVYMEALTTNTDDILIGVKPSGAFIEVMRIRPGMAFLFYCGSNDPWGQAVSGTQKLKFSMLES